MVNIAVLGYGTVGSGVVEVINTNMTIVNKRAGQEINVKRSALILGSFLGILSRTFSPMILKIYLTTMI